MMLTWLIAVILLTMLLCLVRALLGPTTYDRIIAINMFGTATVLFITVHGFWKGRPVFIDIALVYALINFIATISVLRFLEREGVDVVDVLQKEVHRID